MVVKPPVPPSIGRLHGTATEATKRFSADAAQRRAAAESPASIILNVKDVQGEYDGGRLLETTLGGVKRAITADDLAAFRRNVVTVQKSFKGGIRARKVLDMSLPIDRERAGKQIHHAVPVSAKNGVIRFVTNAGPDSKDTRHHVNVEFLSFGAAASAGRGDAKKMANWLRKEPLKFDCSCGRHQFWFRYIATIGGFNAGRPETGFPKIRNPDLHGVACKHVLRVMAEVESSGAVLGFLTKLLDKARSADDAKASHKTTQAEAEGMAKKQGGSRAIKTTETRSQTNAIARQKKALAEAAKPVPPPKKTAVATRRASAADAKIMAKQLAAFQITPEQLARVLADAKATGAI